MRIKMAQITMEEICTGVFEAMEENKPELISMLETHLDFDRLIPVSFYRAYYKRYGRNPVYPLDGMVKACVLQTLFGFEKDSQLLAVLRCSCELTNYCGFDKVPDKSKLCRFKKDYCEQLREMFELLVELTEPICREIHEKKADYLIYDTTGIESNVAENNPKFMNTKLKEAKKLAKKDTSFDPYKGVYALLPDAAAANPDVRQQYINGHYCYAMKAGILTNGLGIVRHISFFDADFKEKHPELIAKKSDNPALDKEIADSKSLRPVLADFLGVSQILCKLKNVVQNRAVFQGGGSCGCCRLGYTITPAEPDVKGGEAVHFTLDIRGRRCYPGIRSAKNSDSCAWITLQS